MTRDFEGKTEQEAINKAVEELHIEREDFDVEILDNGRRGLFKKANVKIRVHKNRSRSSQSMKRSKRQTMPMFLTQVTMTTTNPTKKRTKRILSQTKSLKHRSASSLTV